MRRLAVVVIAALVGFTACNRTRGSGDEATCGTVGSRLYTLTKDELGKAKVDPAIGRAVADQLPAMRDSLTHVCTESAWSAAARNCMANATDHPAFTACQAQLTDEQRRALDKAARGGTVGSGASGPETPSH